MQAENSPDLFTEVQARRHKQMTIGCSRGASRRQPTPVRSDLPHHFTVFASAYIHPSTNPISYCKLDRMSFNHLKVYNPVALNTLTVLCTHPCYAYPKLSHHPQHNSVLLKQSSPSPPPPPCNLGSACVSVNLPVVSTSSAWNPKYPPSTSALSH